MTEFEERQKQAFDQLREELRQGFNNAAIENHKRTINTISNERKQMLQFIHQHYQPRQASHP